MPMQQCLMSFHTLLLPILGLKIAWSVEVTAYVRELATVQSGDSDERLHDEP